MIFPGITVGDMPTYHTWRRMLVRVRNTKHMYYKNYGGRGIGVDPRWLSFRNFLADMGERPLGPTQFTLDRIDNDKGYGPDNCRWATRKQQSQNRRPWKHTPEGLANIAAAASVTGARRKGEKRNALRK